jgi:hypothetical protein
VCVPVAAPQHVDESVGKRDIPENNDGIDRFPDDDRRSLRRGAVPTQFRVDDHCCDQPALGAGCVADVDDRAVVDVGQVVHQ